MTREDIAFWKPEKPNCGWPFIGEKEDGYAFRSDAGIMVIISGQIENNQKWIHVSLSRKNRMPSYEDIAMVKRVFIGDDKKAVMILPERKYHVNIHEYCLHLWHCVPGDGLPEFSHGLGTI